MRYFMMQVLPLIIVVLSLGEAVLIAVTGPPTSLVTAVSWPVLVALWAGSYWLLAKSQDGA